MFLSKEMLMHPQTNIHIMRTTVVFANRLPPFFLGFRSVLNMKSSNQNLFQIPKNIKCATERCFVPCEGDAMLFRS